MTVTCPLIHITNDNLSELSLRTFYVKAPIVNPTISSQYRTTLLNKKRASLSGFVFYPSPEAVNVKHNELLRCGGTVFWCGLWGKGGGGSNGLCVSSPTYMLQVPVCQDSQRALPGVSWVWSFWGLNQEMIATSHDSWCGLLVIWYICWDPGAAS